MIRVEIGDGQGAAPPSVEAYFDGNAFRAMTKGDAIEIRRSQTLTRIVRLKQVSFLELLRKKLL